MRFVRPVVMTVLLVSMLVFSAGCGIINRHKAEKTITMTALHLPDAPLHINSRNGRVSVIADPSIDEVVIEATIRCSGATRVEANDRVQLATLSIARDTSRTLVIEPVFPDTPKGRSNDGATITVRLPDARDVRITTGNGRIEASGLAGTLIATTSNGRIVVEGNDGPVKARSSNGRIIARDIHGSVIATTSNGHIILENIHGRATADTSNGSIDVHLADGQYGPVHADSSNGSVMMSVGAGFAGRVELDTSNSSCSVIDEAGRVTHSSMKKRGGHVVVGEGGSESLLDTSNGKVTLKIRG